MRAIRRASQSISNSSFSETVKLGKASELTGLEGTPVRDNPGSAGKPEYYDASRDPFEPPSGEVIV